MISIKNINLIPSAVRRVYQRSYKAVSSLFERSPKHDYFLIRKTDKIPISLFPSNSWPIKSDSITFSVINVGKKSDPDYKKDIITFYDWLNRPLAKCFSGTGLKPKIRNYDYKKMKTPTNEDTNVRNIHIEEFDGMPYFAQQYGYDLKTLSLFGKWKTLRHEMQCVSKLSNAKKLSILKEEYHPNSRSISVVEYPATLKQEPKSAKKELYADIVNDGRVLKIESIKHSKNINIPKNDDLLPYRFLTALEKCQELPYFYLKKHGLHNMGISVEVPSKKVDQNSLAHFSERDRAIRIRTVPYYGSIAEIAGHETEHAYQHSQIGRAGKGDGCFEQDCLKAFGPIKKVDELIEAQKYKIACDKYPLKHSPDYAKKHDENYLEIKAKEAGIKAEKEYSKGQNVLKGSFKYFPDIRNLF